MEPRVLSLIESQGFSYIAPLGSGAFATVHHCASRKGNPIAIKLAFDERGRRAAARELDALLAIPTHQNLIKLVYYYSDWQSSLLGMPLIAEDSLQLMMRRGCIGLPEDDVRRIFTQLVEVVDHLHKSGFIHRDIKCENILLGGPDRRQLTLTDLGFAGPWKPNQKLTTVLGSPHYSPPEMILRQPYEGPEIDVWSMGVVLYAWSAGRLPFGGHTDEALARNIVAGTYYVPISFSTDLRDLITSMLELDPARRITIDKIRRHPWMTLTLDPFLFSTPMGVRRNVSSPPENAAQMIAQSHKSVEDPGLPRHGRSASLSSVPQLALRKKKGKGLGGSAIGLLKFFISKDK